MSSKPDSDLANLHLITEPVRWQILQALTIEPLTVSEIAGYLCTTSQHVNGHVTRMAEAGLVVVKQEKPEKGMPVKVVHLVPRSWTVSLSKRGINFATKTLKA